MRGEDQVVPPVKSLQAHERRLLIDVGLRTANARPHTLRFGIQPGIDFHHDDDGAVADFHFFTRFSPLPDLRRGTSEAAFCPRCGRSD